MLCKNTFIMNERCLILSCNNHFGYYWIWKENLHKDTVWVSLNSFHVHVLLRIRKCIEKIKRWFNNVIELSRHFKTCLKSVIKYFFFHYESYFMYKVLYVGNFLTYALHNLYRYCVHILSYFTCYCTHVYVSIKIGTHKNCIEYINIVHVHIALKIKF